MTRQLLFICYDIVMHHIQKKIIESLTLAPTRRYSEMRPPRIESNQFAYHLKQLIKNDMVEKNGDEYELTANGLSYVDKISLETFTTRRQPKIITLLDITEAGGETVLLKREHQPYYGKILFPTGKMHMHETMIEAAQRECREKLGFENVPLEHRGVVMVGGTRKGVLISQVLAHVFHADIKKQPIKSKHKGSTSFWGRPEDYPKDEYLAGFFEIKKFLAKNDTFFYEEFWFEV